ncbi:PAP2 superfamily protein [Xylophilus ampelinus]|nr:phosphatase PAP2 family protein [Variovorax sp.]VTY40213.1 PAP2 superfamily protein [Xylophilus ampelinus]
MPPEHADWAALGERIGTLAWPGFPIALAVLVAVLALTGRRLEGPLRQRAGRAEPRPRDLVIGLALGFGAIVALAMLFARLAAGLGDGRPMGEMDDALSRAIGLHTPMAVRQAFGWFTHLGDPWPMTVYCTAAALLLWRHGHRSFAVGWVLANGGNAALNLSLKNVFERVRPVHDTALAQAPGFSFPSGHTSSAVVMWGMLAYLALRLAPPRWQVPVLVLAVAMALSIAASRVFLQVHYLTDILAGLCSGAAWLAVCIASLEAARHRRRMRAHRASQATSA